MTEQASIRILPFKAKKHRRLMPFKKGQGISIAGWQFKIRSVQANGVMNLQCMGKIIGDEEPAASITVPHGVEVAPTKNMAKIDTTRKPLPVVNPCPKCGTEVPDKSYPFTQCPKCLHIIEDPNHAKKDNPN